MKRCIVLYLLIAVSTLLGQLALSTIRGSVKDPAGADAVDAEIKLTNDERNIQRTVRTNSSGDYEFPDVVRGVYRVTATAPGFRAFVADNIILESNQIRRI